MTRFPVPALLLAVSICLAGAAQGQSSLCDYRLSEVIAARAPALAAAAVDLSALGPATGHGGDFFTLVDGRSGLSALGAIVSGAGSSLGAQLLGSGGAVLSGPAIGMAAGAAVLGLGGLEGICRFRAERITDYYEVLAVLSAVADTADPKYFQLQSGPARKKGAVVEIWDAAAGVRRQYRVADLIFVGGELRLNRWGPDRSLGYLMQFEAAAPGLVP